MFITTFLVWSLSVKIQKFQVIEVAKNVFYLVEKKARNSITITDIEKFFMGKIVDQKFFYKIYLTILLSEAIMEKV